MHPQWDFKVCFLRIFLTIITTIVADFSDPYIKVINFSEMTQAKSRESEGAFGRPVDKVLKRYIYILLKLLLAN